MSKPTLKALTFLFFFCFIVNCYPLYSDSIDLKTLFPDPSEMTFFSTADEIIEITYDNLEEIFPEWSYRYKYFNFRRGVVRKYSNKSDFLLIYILDMTTSHYAFETFQVIATTLKLASRGPLINEPIGLSGKYAYPHLYFCQGPYYIGITGAKTLQNHYHYFRLLAEKLAKTIPGKEDLPQGFTLLPKQGRIHTSVKFDNNIWSANYDSGYQIKVQSFSSSKKAMENFTPTTTITMSKEVELSTSEKTAIYRGFKYYLRHKVPSIYLKTVKGRFLFTVDSIQNKEENELIKIAKEIMENLSN